jgi:TPR repeat protein
MNNSRLKNRRRLRKNTVCGDTIWVYFFMVSYSVEKHKTDAFYYFKLAATQNDAEAQNSVGLCYKRGLELVSES